MADMQQLERAFLKAHKAGDTKAAGVLAAEIKRQRSSGGSSGAPAPVSGMLDQFRAGMESNTELPGQTIETLGKTAESQGIQDAGTWLRDLTSQPENFVSATDRFINPKQGDSYVDPVLGFGWGNLPGAAAEVGGQMAGDIAVRAGGAAAGGLTAGPGGAVVGGLTAPAALEFMRVAGPVAQERAKNNGREVPTWEDWQAAAATAGLSGVLNSIGIKGIGALNQGVKEVGKKTAGQVAKEAVKETGKKAGKEGITEFGQSLTEQTGSTIGTDKGWSLDLKQAVGEGILGTGAGGVIDAGRNIPSTVSTVNDIRSVDAAARNDPFARDRAEITQNINDIANGPARDGRELTPGEVSSMVADIQAQAEEAIKGQNLSKEDKAALIKGLKNAKGLSEQRLNEIAGRSESPDEIKALARKVQLVRSMTVQQQARKGARGWVASAARYGGGVAGAAIGQSLGTGAIEGAAIGTGVGRVIAQKLSGSQSQGARINDLIGKKQARRAKMLLDRFGPSEATTALNTLTERAAANKAQQELEAQEQKAWQDTLNRIKMANDIRKKARQEWFDAPPELKAQKKAEKEAIDLKTREERLKGSAIRAEQARVRLEMMANKLETEKSLNALRVEMVQTQNELKQELAKNSATVSKAKADGKVLDLQGKLLKLADDIKLREQALKRSELSTKRAEKMAERVPEAQKAAKAAASQSARRYAKMTSEQVGNVKLDQFGNPIADGASYQMGAEYIMRMESEGLAAAAAYPDKETGNRFIKTINLLHAFKGPKNQERRMAIYNDLMSEVDQSDLDAQRFIVTYIVPLAFAFEGKAGQGASQGFGEDPPF